MFTGIVEAVGRVESVTRAASGLRGRFGGASFDGGLSIGESVAVDGVCLTVVAHGNGWFEAEISPETCRRSTLRTARAGRRVNLERPLAVSGRWGGHFVQGHVDAKGRVRSVKRA